MDSGFFSSKILPFPSVSYGFKGKLHSPRTESQLSSPAGQRSPSFVPDEAERTSQLERRSYDMKRTVPWTKLTLLLTL